MPMPSATGITIPTLATERLLLRGHQLADLPAMTAMWADPHVTRFLGGDPQSSQDTWIRFLRYAGHWTLLGYGYWAVQEKSSGRFIGEAGFADYHRLLDPPLTLSPEIGWVFASQAHGKGYATEAARAMLSWGQQHFDPAQPVRCLIEEGHTASRHVALKVGLRELCTALYRGKPAWILERPADLPDPPHNQ